MVPFDRDHFADLQYILTLLDCCNTNIIFFILFLKRSNYNLTCCNCCQVTSTKKKGKMSIIYRVGTKRTAFPLLLPVAAFHSQRGGHPLWVWQMLSPTSACSVLSLPRGSQSGWIMTWHFVTGMLASLYLGYILINADLHSTKNIGNYYIGNY